VPNPWVQFRRLVGQEPLLVADVIAHNADGTSTVQTPEGHTLRVRGQSVSVGSKAFVRAGQIEGEAPALPAYTVEV